jgi:polysaccharide deacetylase family sporulation protein PdaB
MNWFWSISERKIKRLIILSVAVLFAAGIAYTEKENITVFSKIRNEEPKAIYNVKTKEKKVALTFDISWGEEMTTPILDVLEKKEIKNATFFLSSPWSQNHPKLIQRILDMKYEIGSHGHKHVNYSTLPDEQIRAQILTAENILTKITGQKPSLIRFPNGDFDKRVLRIANELGYTTIQWDTDSLDWLRPGTDKIIRRVVSKAHPGDIILFHASDSAPQTAEALSQIIDQLRAKGYQFVTVSQLIAASQIELKEIID